MVMALILVMAPIPDMRPIAQTPTRLCLRAEALRPVSLADIARHRYGSAHSIISRRLAAGAPAGSWVVARLGSSRREGAWAGDFAGVSSALRIIGFMAMPGGARCVQTGVPGGASDETGWSLDDSGRAERGRCHTRRDAFARADAFVHGSKRRRG